MQHRMRPEVERDLSSCVFCVKRLEGKPIPGIVRTIFIRSDLQHVTRDWMVIGCGIVSIRTQRGYPAGLGEFAKKL